MRRQKVGMRPGADLQEFQIPVNLQAFPLPANEIAEILSGANAG